MAEDRSKKRPCPEAPVEGPPPYKFAAPVGRDRLSERYVQQLRRLGAPVPKDRKK